MQSNPFMPADGLAAAMEPETQGGFNRARQLMFAPELGLALLENCPSKPREQQIWTLRLSDSGPAAAPAAPSKPRSEPHIVEDAVVSVLSPTRVDLTWKASADVRVTTYSDTTAGKSSRRYYVVAVDTLGQEGFPSAPVWFEREWEQYYKPFVGEWHQ